MKNAEIIMGGVEEEEEVEAAVGEEAVEVVASGKITTTLPRI